MKHKLHLNKKILPKLTKKKMDRFDSKLDMGEEKSVKAIQVHHIVQETDKDINYF